MMVLQCLIDVEPIVVIVWSGVTFASHRSVGRGYAGALYYIPAVIGAILVMTLPSSNRIGLLFSFWTTSKLSVLPAALMLRISPLGHFLNSFQSSLSLHLLYSWVGQGPLRRAIRNVSLNVELMFHRT